MAMSSRLCTSPAWTAALLHVRPCPRLRACVSRKSVTAAPAACGRRWVGGEIEKKVVAFASAQIDGLHRGRALVKKFAEVLPIPCAAAPIRKTLVSDLRDSLNDEEMGLRVLWAPRGAGKTTLVLHAAHQERTAGRQIAFLSAHSLNYPLPSGKHEHLLGWLMSTLGVPPSHSGDRPPTLSDLLPDVKAPSSAVSSISSSSRGSCAGGGVEGGTSALARIQLHQPVIMIDQAEHLWQLPDAKRALITLAEESVNRGRFSVLLSVSDSAVAKGILELNGGIKISAVRTQHPLKWSAADIDALMVEKRMTVEGGWEPHCLNEVRALLRRAGSPGILLRAARFRQDFSRDQPVSPARIIRALLPAVERAELAWTKGPAEAYF